MSKLNNDLVISIALIAVFILFLIYATLDRDIDGITREHVDNLFNQDVTERIDTVYEARYQYENNKYITVSFSPNDVSGNFVKDTAERKLKEIAADQNIHLPTGFENYIEVRPIHTIIRYEILEDDEEHVP